MACGASWAESWGPGVYSGNGSADGGRHDDASNSRWGPFATWKTWEIVAMIVGFVVFWPIGLAFLLWKIWGAKAMCRHKQHGGWSRRAYRGEGLRRNTGNMAFEEYKAAELERLERERQRLAEEQKAFGEFLDELKRKKDREEFDRFMSSRGPIIDDGEGAPASA
jgi:hypothetical protein